jgi:hypothetical protein
MNGFEKYHKYGILYGNILKNTQDNYIFRIILSVFK